MVEATSLGITATEAVIENVGDSPDTVEFDVVTGKTTAASETATLPEMTLEERMEEDAAFLAEHQCTPEMIAEQQQALDAAAA